MFLIRFITTLLMVFAFGLSGATVACGDSDSGALRNCATVGEDGKCTLYSVSIIDLIANPEVYHKKRIRTIGYMNLEFEGNAIYLHKTDYVHALHKNGLWVSFAPGVIDGGIVKTGPNSFSSKKYDYSQKYVLVEGIFDAKTNGHMGLWSGAIKNITRVLIRIGRKANSKKSPRDQAE